MSFPDSETQPLHYALQHLDKRGATEDPRKKEFGFGKRPLVSAVGLVKRAWVFLMTPNKYTRIED